MKTLVSNKWLLLPILAIFLALSNFSFDDPAIASTTDTWEVLTPVAAGATVVKEWPKSVRNGNPTTSIQVDVDTSAASGQDTLDVIVYTSQFVDPEDDQWVAAETFGIRGDATGPTTVTLSARYRKLKVSVTSQDSVSNTVSWNLWVN